MLASKLWVNSVVSELIVCMNALKETFLNRT